MPLKKNDEIRLKIDSVSSLGSGVGHYGEMAVFVSNTAAGDDIIAHIIKVKKTYAVAKIKKLLSPSKDRAPQSCESFERCGGCAYRHITYEAEKKIKYNKVKDALRRIGHIDIEPCEIIGAEATERYRNKAQYPVSLSKDGDVVIGFYSPKSHRVTDSNDCLLQPEQFSAILNSIRSWILTSGVTIYDEDSGTGALRHIYIRRAYHTGETMVCLVINSKSVPKKQALVSSLLETDQSIKSILLNINEEKTNVILGRECVHLFGDGYITDILCGKKIRISPLSFYQVNTAQTEVLYAKAREYACLTGSETLLDLYCGAGTIGLSMSDSVKTLIGVEVIPEAIEDAKINAELNSVTNAQFICDDAKGAARTLFERNIHPDVVILDPPRKGCSREVLETVSQMSPDRIVYVSCDPATLARDCEILINLGYELKEATPVDLFPRTVHVESVVLLSQRRPDEHIDIKLDLSELDVTAAETKATYQEIKDYVFDKFGLKVSSLYISQVKTKCGIIERENYNKPKSENTKQPKCPKDKEDAIMDALRHFKMI